VAEGAAKVSDQAGQVYRLWATGQTELTRTAAEMLIEDCAALMAEAQRLRGEVHQIPSLELASVAHATAQALKGRAAETPALTTDKGTPETPAKAKKPSKRKA